MLKKNRIIFLFLLFSHAYLLCSESVYVLHKNKLHTVDMPCSPYLTGLLKEFIKVQIPDLSDKKFSLAVPMKKQSLLKNEDLVQSGLTLITIEADQNQLTSKL